MLGTCRGGLWRQNGAGSKASNAGRGLGAAHPFSSGSHQAPYQLCGSQKDGAWSLDLPHLGLLAALPAAHREVRHSVVVRLEHPGVLENVISKCVEPVQRDQDLSAGDPLLGKGTGTPSASALCLLYWEILLPGPRSGGGPGAQGQARLRQILRGGQESGGLGQSWGCTALVRSPNALVPLSPSVKCSRLEAP